MCRKGLWDARHSIADGTVAPEELFSVLITVGGTGGQH